MAFVFCATFVGFQVIRTSPPAAHAADVVTTRSPRSRSSGRSHRGEQKTPISTILGAVAVAASVTNIVSGFLITDRMLKMFRERRPKS